MPKIFLIKNRLLQQQQRLLETSKIPLADTPGGDDADLDNGVSNSKPQKFSIQHLSSLKLESDNDGSRSDEAPDDEPLSLVVKKGKDRCFYFFSPPNNKIAFSDKSTFWLHTINRMKKDGR